MRESLVVPLIFAVLYMLAYGTERGLYVGDIDRIDRGTLLQKDCHYLTWKGVQTVIAAESQSCDWFAQAFGWR